MNREVIFRGKKLNNGEWVYGSFTHVHDAHGNYSIIPIGQNAFVSVDNSTISEFTNFCDKNGTRIFECDIVNWGNHIGEIIWDDGFLIDCTKNEGEEGVYDLYDAITTDMIVLGNIYDNPERLIRH